MKSFLVPIGGSDTDEALFATALAAAQPFASHMNFPRACRARPGSSKHAARGVCDGSGAVERP
jgi:hypothetical protein